MDELMKLIARLGLLAALLPLLPDPAFAQGVPVFQLGTATQRNVAAFGRNGQIVDGSVSGIGNLKVSGADPLCIYDLLPTSSYSLCFNTDSGSGIGQIEYGALGVAPAKAFNFIINGTTYPFPGTLLPFGPVNAVATTPRGIFSAVSGYPQNLFSVTDSTSAGAPGFNQPAVIGTEFDLTVPGGGTIDNAIHIPLVAAVKLTGAKTYAVGGELESVFGVFFTGDASATCGGSVSPGTSACKVYGGAVAGTLSAGATGFNAVTGLEIDVAIYTGASADFRVGLLVADLNSATRGTVFDAAIDIGRVPGNGGSAGFFYGLHFGGGITGQAGVATDGTLIGSSTAHTVANLINFFNTTCTGSAFTIQSGGAWNCDGRLLLQTATATPVLALQTTGAADLNVNMIAGAGSRAATTTYIDGVAVKFVLGKSAVQDFYGYDQVNADNFLKVTSAGLMTMGEAAAGAGNQLVLSRAGAASLTNMPASAGAGGLYVCADTAGALYRKATCP